MARAEVRGTFSQPGPRRPASTGRLARTLGVKFPLCNPDINLHESTCINSFRRINHWLRFPRRLRRRRRNERPKGSIIYNKDASG
ncbi:hypothetical protein RA210_U510006 [Rubrivivax sp. A210]|nr:hypothetical protein RA210_U510006 [Rubrivivax sp. A210]